jgi:hypothetical protein
VRGETAGGLVSEADGPFSHVAGFTGYMGIVASRFARAPCLRILELRAGNGLLADALRAAGHETANRGGVPPRGTRASRRSRARDRAAVPRDAMAGPRAS